MASQPSPSRSMAPGAKFSTKTSARFAISLTNAKSGSDLRLIVTDFVGVVDHEVIGVGVGLRTGAQGLRRAAALRVFYLDDFGAQPGEHLGAGGARLKLREVEDSDPVEAVRCYADIADIVHRS